MKADINAVARFSALHHVELLDREELSVSRKWQQKRGSHVNCENLKQTDNIIEPLEASSATPHARRRRRRSTRMGKWCECQRICGA